MGKWIGRAIMIVVAGVVGWATFDLHRAGYFVMPELDDGEYPISFANGLRAIVVDPDVSNPHRIDDISNLRRLKGANPGRKYLGVTYEVPSWFEDAWSYCEKPPEEVTKAILDTMPEDMRRKFISARLDAICTIQADGQKIPRGLVFSVPKL